MEQVNTFNDYQKQNGPYLETYNPGWRNHPNFSWKQNQSTDQGRATNHSHNQYPPGEAKHGHSVGSTSNICLPSPSEARVDVIVIGRDPQ
jgi:hypothetical protein